MPPAPPAPDLVVVGGLTVDRFADGSSAAGGSVIHAGLSAAVNGASLATVTVCGDEPEALDGLRRLEGLGPVVRQRSATSVVYAHHEADGHRVLVLDSLAEPLSEPTLREAPDASVALLAPIANELTASRIDAVWDAAHPSLVVLLIQGWLRELHVGRPVGPRPVAALDDAEVAAFGRADAVVVSTEDLAESPTDPFAQAKVLRDALGPQPLIIVTLGADGFLLDDPSQPRIIASVPRRVVEGVPTVGAGDTFGAGFALALAGGRSPLDAAQDGADAVISMLETRRR
jgi:sugar/nucleoside kinase (ribokinase family)